MPTPNKIRTPEICRGIRNCLDADAPLTRIAAVLSVTPRAVMRAIEDGSADDAPIHLKGIAEAYGRREARAGERDQKARNSLQFLAESLENA